MNKNFTVRPLQDSDTAEWFRMRVTLWDDSTEADLDDCRSTPNTATFVIERGERRLGGFIEIGQRDYAEGCESSPVAYIEGWYVDEDLRGQGWGKALVMAAEAWARSQALTEIASDTWLDNETSIRAHLALGYEETERLVTFRKKL